jgi:hypothetical protein
MKLIVITDGSTENFEKMLDIVGKTKIPSLFIITKLCDETSEYNFLLDNIKWFSEKGDLQLLVAKFSGRETVANELGDVCPEMIVPLSYNKQSRYYAEQPVKTFLDLVHIFNRGDLNGIRT